MAVLLDLQGVGCLFCRNEVVVFDILQQHDGETSVIIQRFVSCLAERGIVGVVLDRVCGRGLRDRFGLGGGEDAVTGGGGGGVEYFAVGEHGRLCHDNAVVDLRVNGLGAVDRGTVGGGVIEIAQRHGGGFVAARPVSPGGFGRGLVEQRFCGELSVVEFVYKTIAAGEDIAVVRGSDSEIIVVVVLKPDPAVLSIGLGIIILNRRDRFFAEGDVGGGVAGPAVHRDGRAGGDDDLVADLEYLACFDQVQLGDDPAALFDLILAVLV